MKTISAHTRSAVLKHEKTLQGCTYKHSIMFMVTNLRSLPMERSSMPIQTGSRRRRKERLYVYRIVLYGMYVFTGVHVECGVNYI